MREKRNREGEAEIGRLEGLSERYFSYLNIDICKNYIFFFIKRYHTYRLDTMTCTRALSYYILSSALHILCICILDIILVYHIFYNNLSFVFVFYAWLFHKTHIYRLFYSLIYHLNFSYNVYDFNYMLFHASVSLFLSIASVPREKMQHYLYAIKAVQKDISRTHEQRLSICLEPLSNIATQ